ncbi:hypothetical protein AHAS_Ahas02G0097500 [Arachis hypogaea]
MKILELVYDHHGRLEQLELEAERQREAKRELQKKERRRKVLEEKILMLEADLQRRSNRADWEKSPLGGEDPFVEEIRKVRVPKNFKTPDVDLYEGTTNLRHHLSNFKSWMYLADAS